MSLEIKVNGKSLSAQSGASIFECSEELGVHVVAIHDDILTTMHTV